ncbi:MAG TPA: AAA family ATPase [Acidobacteriota bacterium]|jgi:type II secretory pathway predicted ATPase ExeA|nr:AAA family ATPase [Acidobacteriota bacterium]
MYIEYFELNEKAFGNTPDPRFLYPCRQHQEALARLEYSVEERGIALITGEIGTGKTTVSRALIDSLEKNYKPVLFLNPRFAPAQFLRTLAQKLEIKPKHVKSEIVEQIHSKLFEYYERSITPIVIVDEAQLIPGKALFDEIRLLTNFQLDHTNLLSVILIGQPELARRLLHPAHAALNQRITIRFHLRPLEEQDVYEYLMFRWTTAGGTESTFPFPPMAITKIHSYSGGVPRLINSLATTCLIDALAKEVREINPAMVDQQAAEIGLQMVSVTKLGERHGRHGRSAQAR